MDLTPEELKDVLNILVNPPVDKSVRVLVNLDINLDLSDEQNESTGKYQDSEELNFDD